ncbi:MAG: histidinol dehydrogenase [Ekhidna sp.]
MKNYKYPSKLDWPELCQRPTFDLSEMEERVEPIMDSVRAKGDKALLRYNKQFDGVEMDDLVADLSNQKYEIDPSLAEAIIIAKSNIEDFHFAQKEEKHIIETMPGVNCWRKSVGIQKVGLYIPGGSAPLFSTLLMLAIPAKIAGCKEIVVCTPPTKSGELNKVIGWTCKLLGIDKIFLTGGAQAIAAMTFGTESIPKVDKIFGPGNQYVTAAKQMAQNFGVAIDMPAGPSEVLVIADDTAYPAFVAADLLSQAEHGGDSQVILVSNSEKLISEVAVEVKNQVEKLPRVKIAKKALINSQSILVSSLDDAVNFSNEYAPEHLIIATEDAEILAEKVTIAGSVFLGNWSCESAGDYASGTNHTLPTNGYARNYSGVSLDSFVKKITFQKLTKNGIQQLGPHIEKMAEAEQLQGHKNAVSLRLEKINSNLPQPPSKRGNNTPSTPPLEGEATLWKYVLRASGLGYPFKRQRPIDNYIVDFVSLPLKLIIEVDGITHSYEDVATKDEIRQKALENLGFTIIRIPDDAILSNIDRVKNYLLEEIKNLPPTPSKGGSKDEKNV